MKMASVAASPLPLLLLLACSLALAAEPLAPDAAAASAAASASAAPTNICGQNATVGGWVVSAFNLSYPGLEAVAAAAHKGDLNTACELIAEYYKTSDSGSWLRVPAPPPSSKRAGGLPDEALDDVFYLSGVDLKTKVPRNADGGLDWYYKGPRDDPECMNCKPVCRRPALPCPLLSLALVAVVAAVLASCFFFLLRDMAPFLTPPPPS